MQPAWPARASAPAELRVAVTLQRCAVGAPARQLAAQRLQLPRPAVRRGSDRVGGAASRSARVQAAGSDRLGAAGSGADAAPPRRRGRPRKAADGKAAQAEPPPRKPQAWYTGEVGEKTADGRPKPDERTVADLVERGWLKTEEAVVALLTRAPSREHRFTYETAKPAADWLDATLGLEPLKGGVLPAAKAVKLFPGLLLCDAATLLRKWDALMLPVELGGVGIALSQEQAREAVLKHPRILSYTTDKLQRGWSMLTATEGGLGLSPVAARSCILRSPNVLRFDNDEVVRRVELLKSLGYPKAYEMVLKGSTVLNFKEQTVREHDAWWKQTGLDHVKIVESHPDLLGAPSAAVLQAKLGFLSGVAGMSIAELNKAGSLFTRSLDKRLRARFFYALQDGNLARFTSKSTMLIVTDAAFLAMLQGRSSTTKELASEPEVESYKAHVASAEFVAWREEQEAQLMAAAPQAAADAAHQQRVRR